MPCVCQYKEPLNVVLLLLNISIGFTRDPTKEKGVLTNAHKGLQILALITKPLSKDTFIN